MSLLRRALTCVVSCAVVVAPLTLLPAAAHADPPATGPGSLDSSFGNFGGAEQFGNGFTEALDSTVVQADGRIVAAFVGAGGLYVARRLPGGSADPSWHLGDVYFWSGAGTPGDSPKGALAQDGSGRTYVTSAVNPSSTHPLVAVLRLDANGDPDPSWGPGGVRTLDVGGNPNDHGTGIVVDPATGRVYISVWQGPNGNTDFGVAAFTPGGALDTAFSGDGLASIDFNGGDDTARDLVLTPDGGVVEAGYVKHPGGGQDDTGFWRLTPTGAPGPSFGTNGTQQYDFGADANDGARSIAADGNTYYASLRDESGTTSGAVVEINGKGVPVPAFGTGAAGAGVVRTTFADPSDAAGITVDGRGRLVVVGGASVPTVSRLVPDRYADDTTFATTGRETLTCPNLATTGSAQAVAVQPDGKIVVVGTCPDTSAAHNASVPTIWRLDGGDQVTLPATPATGGDGVTGGRLTASAISAGGGGRTINVAPGASFSLSLQWQINASAPSCPGCIDQVVAGFVNRGPELCVNQPGGEVNTAGPLSGSLTAPNRPGHYYVAIDKVQYYGCETGSVDPGSEGWADVGSPWWADVVPRPPAYLVEVIVAGVSGVALTSSPATAPAGHHAIPVDDVSLDSLVGSLGALQASPLRGSPLRGSPLRGSPLRGSPLRGSPLRGSPLRGSPLRGSPLRGSPIPLSELPLTPPASWAAVLANTPYAGQPLQNVTVQQVLALPSPSPLDQFSLADVDLSRTPLRDVSLVAFLLGNTAVSALGLTDLPAGVDTSQSAIGLELAGVDLSRAYSHGVTFVNKSLVDAPLSGIRLADMWLSQTPLGAVHTADVPLAWISGCTAAVCPTLADVQTHDRDHGLTDAATLGALREVTSQGAGTVAGLTIGQLLPGLVPRDELGYSRMALADIAAAAPLPASGVTYSASFSIDCTTSGQLAATFTLPSGFRPIPATAAVSIPGASVSNVGATAVADGVAVHADVASCADQLAGTAAIQAQPGVDVGATSDSVSVSFAGASTGATDDSPVTVVDNTSPTQLDVDADSQPRSTLFLGRIGAVGEQDSYTLPLPAAGSDLTVTLSHVPSGQDYDLSVFGPGTPDLRSAPLRGSPLRGSPLRGSAVDDTSLDPTTAAGTSSGDVQADVPVQPPTGLTTLGVSAHRGDAEESVAYHVPDGLTGTVHVVVSGYNGSADGADPYSLMVAVSGGPAAPTCTAPSFPSAGTAASGTPAVPADAETLILTDQQRLGDLYGTTAASATIAKLQSLAARTDVKGVVVPVDADADVRAAYAAWNGSSKTATSPCSAASINSVVTQVNRYVDSLLTQNHPRLKYIVIAGGDLVVPMARVQDRMALDNEATYANDEVYGAKDNALSGSLRGGYVLTDDPYGDFNPIPWLDGQAFVPDVALGRLVETPTDIGTAVDAFVRANGVRSPNAAYTAGYDFNADGAQQVADILSRRIPTGAASTSINGTWTKSDAVAGLTAAAHGYGSVNAHYDAYRALPANEFSAGTQSQLLTTADLPSNLDGSVMFTIGCHAGLSVADTFVAAPSEAVRAADWAQTVAARGGLYAANTGYGYGDDTAVAYSEKLMADFASNLDGTVTVGQALMFAKQSGVHLPLSVVDVKVMEEATFYGLPMYRLGASGTSAGSVVPVVPASTDSTATGAPVTAGFTDTTSRHLVAKTSGRGTFFAVQDGSNPAQPPLAIPGRPIEPQTSDVLAPRGDGLPARGVVLTALTTKLVSTNGGFDPVYSTAIPDSTTSSPEPDTLGSYFPSGIASVVERATPAGIRNAVVLNPGQFRAASDTTGLGFQQLADALTYQVLYSDKDDTTPATIATVDGTVSAGHATFTVTTPDPDAASATVLYLVRGGTAPTAWQLVTLTRSPDGHTFTGDSPDLGGATTIEQFFVQLVDSANNVSVSSKKGQGYQAEPAPPAGAPQITVDGSLVNGVYVGPQDVSITGDGAISYTLDGGAPTDYTGPFVVSTAGTHSVTATDASRAPASVTFAIADTPPPTVTITNPSAGTTYIAGVPINAVFSCTGYDVRSCTPSTATPDTSVGSHTFSVTATDARGRSATGSVTYTVGRSPFVGFLQPINDPPGSTPSVFKGGSTVPVKFQLVGTDGRPLADPVATSLATSCFARLSVAKLGGSVGSVDEAVYSDAADSGGCFRYDAASDTFVYNLSTKGLSAGSQYSLKVSFPTGYTGDHSVTVGLR